LSSSKSMSFSNQFLLVCHIILSLAKFTLSYSKYLDLKYQTDERDLVNSFVSLRKTAFAVRLWRLFLKMFADEHFSCIFAKIRLSIFEDINQPCTKFSKCRNDIVVVLRTGFNIFHVLAVRKIHNFFNVYPSLTA